MKVQKRTLPLAAFMILALFFCACAKQPASSWQEQYDLGMRYLSEGKYEEAILAFTAAIDIDPKRAEAFVGRGDAYTAKAKSLEAAEPAAALEQMKEAVEDYQTASDLGASDVGAKLTEAQSAVRTLEEKMSTGGQNDGGNASGDNGQTDGNGTNSGNDGQTGENGDQPGEEHNQGGSDEDGGQNGGSGPSPVADDAEVPALPSPLEKNVREFIGKPDGPLTASDLNGIWSLIILGDTHVYINFQEPVVPWAYPGWEQDMETVDVLYLISPVSLTEMPDFYKEHGSISDISFLRYFRHLARVEIIANRVSDISVLNELENLQEVSFFANEIADTSPLEKYTIYSEFALIQFVNPGDKIR